MNTEYSAPDSATLGAIVSGTHNDPFSILGRHQDATTGDTVVRAFVPGAVSVSLLSGTAGSSPHAVGMQRIHQEGLFEFSARNVAEDYLFEIHYEHASLTVADPYSFGSWLGDMDHHLFSEGEHRHLYRKLGSHVVTHEGCDGTVFVVWAPNAALCSVIGDFNGWDARRHVMRRHPSSGLWEIFIPGVGEGATYKYAIVDNGGQNTVFKTDPFGQQFEEPPGNATIVTCSHHTWNDDEWLASNRQDLKLDQPVSIYEVHLPSWMQHHDGSYYNYREIAEKLIPHVVGLGFTHIELMPVTEHPFVGSWGYQPIGLYAPMGRLGTPDDFRSFVDSCHQAGLGVLVDWVPAHFPFDEHGLSRFDGTALYEHEDPRKGVHREWNTGIFNYARSEVSNYLLSNALFWIEEFHLDGLRVDAVASMLYLDYSRDESDWVPNDFGGNQNLDAITFLQRLNTWVHGVGAVTFAEESTSWEGVTRPVEQNGLGFTYKWNMGWMNDILSYFEEDPINRKHHHEKLTFGQLYAFSENFVLPFSHDEVVYGKKSLFNKMPGDDWQKFANLRLLYCFQFTQPGKKLVFMGSELAQISEWNHDAEVEWYLAQFESHRAMKTLLARLNELYRDEPSLHKGDANELGFQWIDCDDAEQSVIAYYRRVPNSPESVICVLNFTPVVREDLVIGVYDAGEYMELFNSDHTDYGGSHVVNTGILKTESHEYQGKPHRLRLRVPPLAAVFLKQI